jgi:hypothetical protein
VAVEKKELNINPLINPFPLGQCFPNLFNLQTWKKFWRTTKSKKNSSTYYKNTTLFYTFNNWYCKLAKKRYSLFLAGEIQIQIQIQIQTGLWETLP